MISHWPALILLTSLFYRPFTIAEELQVITSILNAYLFKLIATLAYLVCSSPLYLSEGEKIEKYESERWDKAK